MSSLCLRDMKFSSRHQNSSKQLGSLIRALQSPATAPTKPNLPRMHVSDSLKSCFFVRPFLPIKALWLQSHGSARARVSTPASRRLVGVGTAPSARRGAAKHLLRGQTACSRGTAHRALAPRSPHDPACGQRATRPPACPPRASSGSPAAQRGLISAITLQRSLSVDAK